MDSDLIVLRLPSLMKTSSVVGQSLIRTDGRRLTSMGRLALTLAGCVTRSRPQEFRHQPRSPNYQRLTEFMPSSCKDIRAELAKCVQRSECVLIQRHTPAECLRNKELYDRLVPDECHRLRRCYFDCRRGWVFPLRVNVMD